MAKSDLPLSAINLRPVFRKVGKPTFAGEKRINGLDSETADGRVFLLTAYYEMLGPKEVHNDGGVCTPEQCFRFLTNRNLRGCLNVWYNLDFDANVILSLLPKECLWELVVKNATQWEGYIIQYIPKKVLRIRSPNRETYLHYDVSQFFFGSLDAAAKEWLGIPKLDNVDVTRFGLSAESPDLCNAYIRDNWRDILSYASRDAELVKRLWRAVVEIAEPLDIPCGKPYSFGYLAEQHYNIRFKDQGKPGFGIGGMQEMAWRSYAGGRFEVIERGDIGEVVTVDINSAYPNVLRNLPDPTTLYWRNRVAPILDEIREADYGFVQAIVSTDPTRPLQPFPVKVKGILTFPAMRNYRVITTLQIFLHAIDSGIVTDFFIEESWHARQGQKTRFPFQWVTAMYEERQELKRQGFDKKQKLLKWVLNSLYGKVAQVTDRIVEGDGNNEIPEDWILQPLELYPTEIEAFLRSGNVELFKQHGAGHYFNPFLASYITGQTRLALIEAVESTGLEHATIMLATDSVMIRREAFEQSDFESRYLGKGLGAWERETDGRAFVVGSGVYEVAPPTGKPKTRTRGFTPGVGVFHVDVGESGLTAAARTAGREPITITPKRPLKLRQAIWQGFEPQVVGKFLAFPRDIRAGMDSKRIWPRGSEVTYAELFESPERSTPILAASNLP